MTSIDSASRSSSTSRSTSNSSSTSDSSSASKSASSSTSSTTETSSSTNVEATRDVMQTSDQQVQEARAKELVGADASVRAPEAAVQTAAAGQVRPKRGLSDLSNATAANTSAPTELSADASAAADAAAPVDAAADAPPVEPASEVATRVNDLAATDPEGAARLYADTIEANEDPAYRAELTEAAQPGLEQIGTAAASEDGPSEGTVRELSRASEALHADGQADTARQLADGFARGADVASRENTEKAGMPAGSPALSDAFAAQVASGQGANFAADVTSSLSDSARAARDAPLDHAEVQRRQNLTFSAADGVTRGLDTLSGRFADQGAALAERSARLGTAEAAFGPHLTDEQRAAAQSATAEETARLVGEYETSAGQLTSALDAAARAYDTVAANGNGQPPLSFEQNTLLAGIQNAAEQMPAASSTLTGQAAMADTVARQAAGERTWLDSVADMGVSVSGEARHGAFVAATQGAALLGAADYGSGGTLDRARDAIARNASALLDERGQAAVNEALAGMEGAGSSAEAFTRFADSLERNEDALGGPQVANALGAMGTILSRPEAISSSPAYGRYSSGASILASAAGLALSGPGDTFQERVAFGIGAANVATDALELLAPGTRLGNWAAVGGRVLGAAGAGLGLVDAVGRGDVVGVASNGLALYGALAMNPYAAVAAGLIEGGRFLWNVREDNLAQSAANAEYLRGAGLSAENADFVGGIGNYGPPLLSESGRQHSGIDDLNARIDFYREGGDYGAPLDLMQASGY